MKDYQLYFGLSITGNLDEPTITQMQKPRCGLPDLLPGEDVREKVNDYSLSGGRWENTNIRYFFQNGTSDISGTTEWDIMRQAMDRWADVTPLTFTQVTTEADADIRFYGRQEVMEMTIPLMVLEMYWLTLSIHPCKLTSYCW